MLFPYFFSMLKYEIKKADVDWGKIGVMGRI